MPSHRRPPLQRPVEWSDGETSALIDAWGPVHQRCRRLALEDWRAVVSAVNAHRAAGGRRFNRTRAQCQTRVHTLKTRYKKELLSLSEKQPPSSGWRHFPRLRAFLANPHGPPPGFPVKTQAAVKDEEEETCEKKDEVGGSGLAGSWTVPRRPSNGTVGTGLCPASVVTKLAEVYERVELARMDAEKVKVEMETEKAMFDAVKVEQQ